MSIGPSEPSYQAMVFGPMGEKEYLDSQTLPPDEIAMLIEEGRLSREGKDSPQDITFAVDMLSKFFAFIFTKQNIRKPLQVAYLMYLFCYTIRPDLIGMNLTQIGELFGKNRRRVSEKLIKLNDSLGIHGRGQKSETARGVYSDITNARLQLIAKEERAKRKLAYDKTYWNQNKAKYNALKRSAYREKRGNL